MQVSPLSGRSARFATPGIKMIERNVNARPRLVWVLLGAATLLLGVAAIVFADGAAAVAASKPRLLLAIASLTLGGTAAVLAVLEAWQPTSHATAYATGQRVTDRPQDPPPGRRSRQATRPAVSSSATQSAPW